MLVLVSTRYLPLLSPPPHPPIAHSHLPVTVCTSVRSAQITDSVRDVRDFTTLGIHPTPLASSGMDQLRVVGGSSVGSSAAFSFFSSSSLLFPLPDSGFSSLPDPSSLFCLRSSFCFLCFSFYSSASFCLLFLLSLPLLFPPLPSLLPLLLHPLCLLLFLQLFLLLLLFLSHALLLLLFLLPPLFLMYLLLRGFLLLVFFLLLLLPLFLPFFLLFFSFCLFGFCLSSVCSSFLFLSGGLFLCWRTIMRAYWVSLWITNPWLVGLWILGVLIYMGLFAPLIRN